MGEHIGLTAEKSEGLREAHMGNKRRDSRDHPQPPETYLEVNNPAIYSVLEPRPPKHPFEGDEHGHERHDTIPAEEEWVEDELEPEEQHNPEKP